MAAGNDMTAVILAGGRGSRLQPYTAELPKPLVEVCGRPIIEILLRCLHRSGVRRAHVAVNHLAHLISDALGDGSRFGMELHYSREEQPLSTIGPLTLIDDLPEQFLVVNGDILTDLDFSRLFQFHSEQGVPLTVATCRRESTNDFGVIDVGPTGLVTGFTEKPTFEFTVSAGIYVFSRSVLDYVPKGEPFGFDQLMLALLSAGESVATYPYDGYWLDIGRHDDYRRANDDAEIVRRLSEEV